MPTLNEAELASRYGFAMAVLNSDPDLKKLFQKAVAQTYTPERFQTELRATGWYQRNGEAMRNASLQKAADPATYNANVAQSRTRLGMMASELGAVITSSQVAQMAETAYMFGWDDNQLRQNLSTYVRYTDGRLIGQAGQWEREMREYADSMGLGISNDRMQRWIANAVGGKGTVEDFKAKIAQEAASAFPHLAERIRSGETVADIAEPYRQQMANLLEVNPAQVTLKDPTIRGALAAKDKDGKAVLRTLYDFENDLRGDPRWLKTKNAQDAAMATTNRVLKDLGVVS